MNGWQVAGITLLSVGILAGVFWVSLAVYAITQLAHVLRGELEPDDDESEDD